MYMEQEVRAGIDYLNSRFPEWQRKINLDQLNVGDAGQCIVGQLEIEDFVEEDTGDMYPFKYGLSIEEHILDGWKNGAENGLETVRRKYSELTDTWKNILCAINSD